MPPVANLDGMLGRAAILKSGLAIQSTRHVLRQETAAAHTRLEELVGPLTGRESYVRYLRVSLGFRQPLEAMLAATAGRWPRCLGEWRPTFIAGLLQRDMNDLDITTTAPHGVELDGDRWSPLGVLYVLEGSSLGAKLLRRDALALGYDDSFGARHLAVQAKSNWGEFVELLERCDERDVADAALAARATFEFACRVAEAIPVDR